MRAKEITEIERLRADDYEGGSDALSDYQPENLQPLPGGSGFQYSVVEKIGWETYTSITLWDPKYRWPNPPKPVRRANEKDWQYEDRLWRWNSNKGRAGKMRAIGQLTLTKATLPLEGALKVETITVDENYRGRGLAKALYGIVLSIMRRPLVAGESQTPGGRKNWVSLSQIPGVEMHGYVSIMDRSIDDGNNIDTLMGKLGAQYIGEVNERHYFAYDVTPGGNEVAARIKTALSQVYDEGGGIRTGLFATWGGINESTDDLEEGLRSALGNLAFAGAVAGGAVGGMNIKQALTSPEEPAATRVAYGPVQGKDRLAPEKMDLSKIQVKPVTESPMERLLMQTARSAGIKGEELIAFMSQCAHESMDFTRLAEAGDPRYFRRYEKRFAPKTAKILGNTQPGDGERFKGRGFIQITGRYNYMLAGKELGLPLVQNPELLEQPQIAAQASVWFWLKRVRPRVDDFNDVEAVTKPINPALKGLQDRLENFKEYWVTAQK